jgi:predicted DCC family thiol-disulfide oxidoreductase YuxK
MRWTVLYDGSCPLCSRGAAALRRLDSKDACDLIGGRQEALAAAPGVTLDALEEALHVLRSDGTLLRGFDAIRELLRLHPLGRLVRPLLFLPPLPWLGRRLYFAVARRRHDLKRLKDGRSAPQKRGIPQSRDKTAMAPPNAGKRAV